ncbi:MAG: LysE family transporter [Proteobacteria bacterium]|nr:LysE family transporter [Pseudomonadota bacterium]
MTLPGIFFSAFLIGFSGAMVPGPVLVYAITSSSKRGFWAGPLLVLGHGILEGLLLILLVLGFAKFLSHELFNGIIALAGAVVLVFMGIGMIREARTASLNVKTDAPVSSLHPVPAGILISISNPFWIIWWATIGLNFLSLSRAYGNLGILTFFSGHLLSDLSWYSLISALVTFGRKLISDQIYRGILVGCALALLGFGVYFGLTGINILFL